MSELFELDEARIRELAQRRRCSQPLELPSAGSTFKRPAQGYAAALIEQAGLSQPWLVKLHAELGLPLCKTEAEFFRQMRERGNR